LHRTKNVSCFVCNALIDDVENHFFTRHQVELSTMNTIGQCCLCGIRCDNTTKFTLLDHQLRVHLGVCYSSVLKQFIRFQPPPPLSSSLVESKNRSILPPISSKRSLTTCTEKKFGCRKCDTSSHLFTFDELVEHLRIVHQLNVKLRRRCIICQQTFIKGKEFNDHCLSHLNDENPSIQLRRHFPIL